MSLALFLRKNKGISISEIMVDNEISLEKHYQKKE